MTRVGTQDQHQEVGKELMPEEEGQKTATDPRTEEAGRFARQAQMDMDVTTEHHAKVASVAPVQTGAPTSANIKPQWHTNLKGTKRKIHEVLANTKASR